MLLAPKIFRSAVKKNLSSIVTIEAFGGMLDSAIGGAAGVGRIAGISKPGEGPTTGVIWSSDGYIVTSTFNFIRKPAFITVVLNDGRRFNAELLGKDNTRKICLLKIKEKVMDLPVPIFSSEKDARIGQWAISVGNGFGGENLAFSVGIISAKNRIFGKVIQTDANTSPANYGGPLIDIEGNVLGICTPLSPRGGRGSGVGWYDSGIGFAVPLGDLKEHLEKLKDPNVKINPGRMGIHIGPADKKGGIAVQNIMQKSPAVIAGLLIGDHILEINGKEVNSVSDMMKIMGRLIAGVSVELKLLRGKKKMTMRIMLVAGEDLFNTEGRSKPKKKRPTKKR